MTSTSYSRYARALSAVRLCFSVLSAVRLAFSVLILMTIQIEDGLKIFDSSTMRLLDECNNKAMKVGAIPCGVAPPAQSGPHRTIFGTHMCVLQVRGIQQFAWSPRKNIIAYFTPEMGESPAKVTLMTIPGREIIRQKNLFR